MRFTVKPARCVHWCADWQRYRALPAFAPFPVTMETEPRDPYLEKKSQELRELKTELSKLQLSFEDLRASQPSYVPQPKKAVDQTNRFLHRPSSSLSKDVRSKVQKVEEHLGTETWSKRQLDDLRYVFVKYASLQNCLKPDGLELSLFFRLLEDCQMLTATMTRARAQLLFFKNNKTRSIDLWRFLEIVAEFAKLKYPDEPRVDALRKYTLVVVVPNSKIEAEQAQLYAWKQDSSELRVRELHYSKRTELLQLFNAYRTLQREYANQILLPAYLNFCCDFKFIPDLITKPEAARLFRAAGQSELFVDALTFDEFQSCCSMQAIAIFSRPEFSEKCPGAVECAETWYFWLEVNAGIIAISEVPVKERGLVVDPTGMVLRL